MNIKSLQFNSKHKYVLLIYNLKHKVWFWLLSNILHKKKDNVT